MEEHKITTEKQLPISKVPVQLQPWMFKKGQSGNPAGRPKGMTLKEYCRDFLSKQTDEERATFLEGLDKETIWKMAEGSPETKTDLTTLGKALPTPLLYGIFDNDSNKENSSTEKED